MKIVSAVAPSTIFPATFPSSSITAHSFRHSVSRRRRQGIRGCGLTGRRCLSSVSIPLLLIYVSLASTWKTAFVSLGLEDENEDNIAPDRLQEVAFEIFPDGMNHPASLENGDGSKSDKNGDGECTLYMAPSTIPNAGLGVFTSKAVRKGEIVGYDDINIPLVELEFHNGAWTDGDGFWYGQVFFNPFQDFVWDGQGANAMQEGNYRNRSGVSLFAPGLDAVINCNAALINVDRTRPRMSVVDAAATHRTKSPGSGAISLYVNSSTVAKTSIPAGSELFKYYGDSWFTTRSAHFGKIPLASDYKKAESFIKTTIFPKLMQSRYPTELKEDLYNTIVNLEYESRLLNALPEAYQDIPQVVTKGIESVHQPGAIRPDLATMKGARCVSNIMRKSSLLPHAGGGAFATRSFQKGDVITGSPVVMVSKDSLFDMYAGNGMINDEGQEERDMSKPLLGRKQLMVNYCWGHSESTVLLCPYGSGVNNINHNATLANVGVRWAPDGEIHQDDSSFEKHPNSMSYIFTAHLAFDYVATRDIEKGDEMYLDYGPEWESAWSTYVSKQWKPTGDVHYEPAAAFNYRARYEGEPLRIGNQDPPYPPNIETRCHPKLLFQTREEYLNSVLVDTEDMDDLRELGILCHIMEKSNDNTGSSSTFKKRDASELTYTVQFRRNEPDGATVSKTLSKVSARMIGLRDRVKSTDIHLPNRFRHWQGLPDEMLPSMWRNKRNRRLDDDRTNEPSFDVDVATD